MPTGDTIYRYATIGELCGAEAQGTADRWLSPDEAQRVHSLKHAGRRRSWLAGRVLAKRMVLDHVVGDGMKRRGIHPARVEIRSGDVRGWRCRPAVWLDGRSLPVSLSISHTDQSVLVALVCRAGVSVGVDLVDHAILRARFVEFWFTEAERRWLETKTDSRWTAAVWAVKEAVYKAVNQGEAFRPRAIEVVLDSRSGGLHALVGRGRRPVAKPCVWSTERNETAALVTQRLDDC